MPNRIIREGILTSEKVNALGWAEEVFYRRLMSAVDDWGRYTAHPKLLRAALYPLLLDRVSDADVGKWMLATAEAGLVSVYTARDGKRYLEILNWRQQVRASTSRYPGRADDGSVHVGCSADAAQMHSTCAAGAEQAPRAGAADAQPLHTLCGDGDEGGDGGGGGESPRPREGGIREATPDWDSARYVAAFHGLVPGWERLPAAAVLNALKVEPDGGYRAKAWNEFAASALGSVEVVKGPVAMLRGYMRNARKADGGALPREPTPEELAAVEEERKRLDRGQF